MPKDEMIAQKTGGIIELERIQWKGEKATVSDYPGLIEEIEKYTWTLTGEIHPYLQSNVLKMSLHKFVLSFLYGQDRVNQMLSAGNIIEHLDNNGLNCTFENLHIISADYNKAKAFTIDKESKAFTGIPSFVTDVYYSHKKQLYQMQIFMNRDLYFLKEELIPIEEFICQYKRFSDLFIDWLYLLNNREKGFFDLTKLHFFAYYYHFRPTFELKNGEEENTIIERDGMHILLLRPNGGDRMTGIIKTAFQELNLE